MYIADKSFEVYRYYLALRLHFTTDQYDAIKQQGRVKASRQAFQKRKDLAGIKRIAETYNEKEVVNFLISNFITGDRWGGVFDTEAKQRYLEWKSRIESLSYTFKEDVTKILSACDKQGIPFKQSWAPTAQHPLILKLYLGSYISIESLVILNQIFNFVPTLDEHLKDDLVWPDISRILKKYTPFLSFQKDKYERIIKQTIEDRCN